VASVWNAVILLDEADIFLERRSKNDIHRNAMVGCFLRLLEYHNGVLFLTTNRVKSFDKAFHSRISIAIKYDDLNESTREKVWKNLLDAAKVVNVESKSLAKFDLNGRQIKNTLRLAQALALSEGKAVETSHIIQTLQVVQQFQTELNAKDLHDSL